MGLWHSRCIDSRIDWNKNVDDHFFSLSLKTYRFKGGGDLGLLSIPHSSSNLYVLSLDLGQSKIGIAIDGYIYNVSRLSAELGLKKNRSVEELITYLYRLYSSEGLYRLEGSFALILYDAAKQITLLYCTFLTGYPLYYAAKNNRLSVSTNPVYLLHRPDVSDSLDHSQISAIFSLDFPGWHSTLFTDLNSVEQGEIVAITPEGIQRRKKPLSELFPVYSYDSEQEVFEHYRQLLDRSINKTIEPGRKYGIMLSSGMDSGSLAALASKQLKKQGRRLTAYSWSLPNDQAGDESTKIKELCEYLGIELKLFNGERFGPFDDLDNIALLPDVPISNPYWPVIEEIYRRASQDGINALLNGNYGDILFPPSRTLFVDILKDRRYELFIPTLKWVVGQAGWCNAIRKSPAISGLLSRFVPLRRQTTHSMPPWMSNKAKESYGQALEKRAAIEEEYGDFLMALSQYMAVYPGMERYLSGEYGIERIEPFRDPELLGYTLGIPSYMTYREGQMKYFAREAMRGLLPESIRTQRRAGNLKQFVDSSFVRNRGKIRKRILDDREPWKRYVDEKWMIQKLRKDAVFTYSDILVIWNSLNIGPWQKAIKPGGFLYEGYSNRDINRD